MKIFDFLFDNKNSDSSEPNIRLGRYSDAYKESDQYDLWDESLIAFDRKEYLRSYKLFLQYLNDPEIDNVIIDQNGADLNFQIVQGSKKLTGRLRQNTIRVESQVAKIKKMDEELLRHLLEYNFVLKYSRFGITADGHISIIFDSSTDDGSPYKLYYALKEVANHSDKQDDLLIYKYTSVEHIDTSLFHHISEAQKEIKYNYLVSNIRECRNFLDSDPNLIDNFSGGIAYLLLSLAYKLDYLIKPEGYLMDRLEEINSIYFNNDIPNTKDKIDKIINEFTLILNREASSLKDEMYWVKSTFGITTPVNHDRIYNFIEGELNNMDWYEENEYDTIAESIPGYIVGYALFHFAPPKPDLELLQFYFKVFESDFFAAFGSTNTYYNPESGEFDRKEIKKAIKRIVQNNDENYPHLDPNLNSLRFGSKAKFARTYLKMIQELDMTRK